MRAINIEPRQTGSPSRHTASAWLKMRIHLDAFRIAPLAYLVAVWWRICGKRVRARARFAPLLSASPRAYGLWLEREVAVARTPHVAGTIVALIDTAAGQEGVDRTLQSLSCENIVGLVIGGPDGLTLAEAARHIPWQDDPWVLAIAPGDRLAPGTRDAYLNALAHDSARHATIAYADDDLMDLSGRRSAPHFKPDWNAELFRHHDYLTGACILHVSESQLSHTSGSGWAAQLVAQTVAAAKAEPVHVRHVLHHRRTRPRPRLPDALAISGALPPVSVIVPTRNGLNLLRKCLEGVARTDYPDIEVIVVDNGSDDPDTLAYLDALDPCRHRVLRAPGPFNFSTLNNRAAQLARGALLCLLNNDIEVLAPDWLGIMATQALREDVGAVGAQLLYPDGRIQHAGVILGICGGATHAHRLLRPDAQGYFNRHALPQFTSAVTAACLVVQRQRFMAVGGLDEANFAVAFNDVDLCMRLNARGWQSFYEPRAVLIHHESVSRGFDRDPVGAERLAGELEAMKTRWGTDAIVDPFHHPDLNRFSDRFVVQL
ncbi:glycosyltransferase family 2 protein [Novosphingobium sp. Leaf2]|uniref:glycosyltransferase family 2 protein n=1 Tax=Novosphingobium sp. Leaf2 TaxID=1735670 RepID=UPI0009EA25EE|nr:glycosyltransferase family 2 protein [Novosphingobium sp. Leaf2]